MTDEIDAIHEYQSKHDTCDIQSHPWQAVFGAGFSAGRDATDALEATQAEVARLRAALDHIHSGASAVISACEAYGETGDLHLWQEVEDEARAALEGTAEAADTRRERP